jgi:hypothetical protein
MESAGKKKVLLSFVGDRDPYPSSWQRLKYFIKTGKANEGSVLTLCRVLRPDKVYLFPSRQKPGLTSSTEGNAIAVKKILKQILPSSECEIFSLDIERANDLPGIYKSFRENVLKVVEGLGPLDEYEFSLNTSSGTQQMSQAAQLYLSTSPLQARYYQCSAPQFVQKREERVRLVSATPIEETALLKQIQDNVARFQFHLLVADCKRLINISPLKERKVIANILSRAFQAYESLEQMEYRNAYNSIQAVQDTMKMTLLPQHLIKILDAQKKFLGSLQDEKEEESVHNLTDLYFNICRAFGRGNYADVLARFWRLREGMLYYRLQACYGVNIRNLNQANPNVQSISHNKTFNGHIVDNRINASSMGLFVNILISLKDTVLEKFERQHDHRGDGKLNRVRETRNHTFIAHGMKPVTKEDAVVCVKLAEEILPLIPGSADVRKDYPFTEENMKGLVSLLVHA